MSQDELSRSEVRRRPLLASSQLIVISLTLASAVGGALAGCHPTDTLVVDQLETAAFAAGFTLAASRASRGTWLALGVGCVVLARGWLLVPASAVIMVAFVTALMSRSQRRLGALIGALGVQVVLRWPPVIFHGLPSLVAAALVVLVGVSAWRRSSRRVRRRAAWVLGGLAAAAVVVSIPAIVATLLIRSPALAAERSAQAALNIIGSGSSQGATTDLQSASTLAEQSDATFAWWLTAGVRAVPILAQQDRYIAGTLRSAARATAVGAREAPAVNYRRLGYHHGQIDLVRLNAMTKPMSILAGALAVTDRQLRGIGSPWLVGPLENRSKSFENSIERALHSARLAVRAARTLPGILGGSGTRNYLVAFMTPAEARGYDGFIGSYGVLTASDGRVRLALSGSIADVIEALPKGGAQLSGPADYLARYGAFHPGQFPEDATYSPDFPSVASVLNQIYTQAGGVHLDGVLAVDPYGLAALLHFTGPVVVPGLPFPLTQANAASVLLKEQYTTFDTGSSDQDAVRHDFLQGALHAAFDALVSGSLPAPRTVSSVLEPAVAAGRISFWSFHASEQPLLRDLGISGSFPKSDGGDLLAVTTQNTGNNKIDAYLHTSVDDQVTFDPSTGQTSSTVTVKLANGAPSAGLPPIVIDSPADPGLPTGTNRTWLTVYSPLAFVGASVDGATETMTTGRELGVHAYSAYVDVPADGTATLRLLLSGRLHPGKRLLVTVRAQPSANRQSVHVDVVPDGPWVLDGVHNASWALGSGAQQRRHFVFNPAN